MGRPWQHHPVVLVHGAAERADDSLGHAALQPHRVADRQGGIADGQPGGVGEDGRAQPVRVDVQHRQVVGGEAADQPGGVLPSVASVTWQLPALPTTWLLVTTSPWASKTTPEPRALTGPDEDHGGFTCLTTCTNCCCRASADGVTRVPVDDAAAGPRSAEAQPARPRQPSPGRPVPTAPAGAGPVRAQLLTLTRDKRPELVVVEVLMPPTSTVEGLDAARVIRKELPEIGILVLSAHVEVGHAMELLALGAESAICSRAGSPTCRS
jgi:CheY-like chemotaxis protein